MYISILLLFACIFVHDTVEALTNITVDDSAGAVAYQPPTDWGRSAPSSLDYGGSHYLSEIQGATATFTFTGVAVYYLSPKWPYLVNTQLSLDGGPGEVVDLVDHSSPTTTGGPESVAYSVVWGKTGLANTEHQLVASMAPNGQFVVVDGFIYTVLNSTSSSVSSPLPSSSSPLPSSSSPSPSSTSDSSSSSHFNRHLITPIAGAVAGFVGLAVLSGILLLFLCRRRRDLSPKDSVRGLQSTGGSIGPGSSSFHFSQSGVMSPTPSVLTTNYARYGAYRPQMASFPEENDHLISHHSFDSPLGPADDSYAPNSPPFETRALYETGASPISRLSTVLEGSASSGRGLTTHVQSLSSAGGPPGYQDGVSTTVFETPSTSSYQPSTSGSKGYTGMQHRHKLDQKEYMSDQTTISSSRKASMLSPLRALSPGPPEYSVE